MNSPETPVSDLLLILAPPLRLVDWLEKVFYQRKVNGEEVPENFVTLPRVETQGLLRKQSTQLQMKQPSGGCLRIYA